MRIPSGFLDPWTDVRHQVGVDPPVGNDTQERQDQNPVLDSDLN